MSLQTEFGFTLPKGYVDGQGGLHRSGTMRLATARDEIEPLRDPRVRENDAFLAVIVLARVITKLGDLEQVTTKVVEGLFTGDLAHLQELYDVINYGDPSSLTEATLTAFPGETPAGSPSPAAVAAAG